MILRALLAHYRRHPLQAVFLLSSIALANVLLVGTQLINAQARASYATGEAVLGAAPVAEIVPRSESRAVDAADYVALRLQGFDMLVPAVRERVRTATGETLDLLGIDALAMPRSAGGTGSDGVGGEPLAGPGGSGFAGFSFPPFELWGSPARLRQLGVADGEVIELDSGRRLPAIRAVEGANLGHRLLLDIGRLKELSGDPGDLSALLVFPAPEARLQSLAAALPPGLELIRTAELPDPAQLTRSFHLNLAAMGLLAFVVGLFLIYNALAFSYTDRHELLRRLRLAGVRRGELARALLLELALFLGIGSAAGGWLGARLAAALLPGVGQTLAQLYDVYIAYPDTLTPAALWLPLAMTGGAAVLCVLYPMRQALRAPLLERWTRRWQVRSSAGRDVGWLLAGCALLAVAGLSAARPAGILAVLAGMAALLLGAALCLPAVLRALVTGLTRLVPERNARSRWLLADSRWLLGPAALALMAVTLALVANSGLNLMIGSFRQATDDWLSQRLASDLYLRGAVDRAALDAWLSATEPALKVTERYRTEADRQTPAGRRMRVEIATLTDETRLADTLQLVRALPGARARFASGDGVFVSERAWRLDGWTPGDPVTLCPARSDLPVLGIYHDYGNPQSQWLVSEAAFRACWPHSEPASLALTGPAGTDWPRLRRGLIDALDLGPEAVIDQAELKTVGLAVFDRTFVVAGALNALTLLVAGIGVFCAVSAIHHHRAARQALLASLGLSFRERGILLLAQWGLLGLLCMALVWPFGTVLAAYLAGVVTPVAFGWSFPLRPDWAHYGWLALVAAAGLVLAVLLPSLRLLRTPPAVMLREEAG